MTGVRGLLARARGGAGPREGGPAAEARHAFEQARAILRRDAMLVVALGPASGVPYASDCVLEIGTSEDGTGPMRNGHGATAPQQKELLGRDASSSGEAAVSTEAPAEPMVSTVTAILRPYAKGAVSALSAGDDVRPSVSPPPPGTASCDGPAVLHTLRPSTRESLLRHLGAAEPPTAPPKLPHINDAITSLSVAIELSPTTSLYYQTRAAAFSRLHEYKLSIFDLTIAIHLEETGSPTGDPAPVKGGRAAEGPTVALAADARKLASYYGARGQAFRLVGRLADSMMDLRRAARLEPGNGAWYYELGITLYENGESDMAVLLFSVAVDGKAVAQAYLVRLGLLSPLDTSTTRKVKTDAGRSTLFRRPSIYASRSMRHISRSGHLSEDGPMTFSKQRSAGGGSSRNKAAERLKSMSKWMERGGGEARTPVPPRPALGVSVATPRSSRTPDRSPSVADEEGAEWFFLTSSTGPLHVAAALMANRITLTRSLLHRCLLYRGNTRRELDFADGAVEDLERALSIEASANAHHLLALALYAAKDYTRALSHFQQASEAVAASYPQRLDERVVPADGEESLASTLCARYESLDTRLDGANARPLGYAANYNNWAMAMAQLGYFEDALRTLDKAQRCDPEMVVVYYNRGNVHLKLQSPSAALVDFEAALTRVPEDEHLHFCLGMTNKDIGDVATAMCFFLSALVRNPVLKPALYELGLLHQKQHEPFAAVECFTKLISADERDPRGHHSLGLVYTSLAYYDLAVAAFSRAVELRPESGVLFYHRGVGLLWLGEYKAAVADMDAALKLGLEEAPVHNARGMGALGLGLCQRALEDVTRAIELDPMNAGYYGNRGHCRLVAGEFEKAIDDLTQALALQDGHGPRLLSLRSKAHYSLGRFDGCIADMRQALAEHMPPPDSHDGHFLMGVAFCNSNRPHDAIACLEEAVRQSDEVVYRHECAKARQLVGNYDAAVRDFSVVIARQPRNVHALFRRALAYKSLGRFEDAAADFEAAKRMAPHDARLAVNYSRILDVDVVELCRPGEEPSYEETPADDGHADAVCGKPIGNSMGVMRG